MLYIAKYRGQEIGRSDELSFHHALKWARTLGVPGVEVRPATLDDLCARPKPKVVKQPRSLQSIINR